MSVFAELNIIPDMEEITDLGVKKTPSISKRGNIH